MFETKNRHIILIGALLITNFLFSKKTFDLGKPFTTKGFALINMAVSILASSTSYFLWIVKSLYQDLFIDLMFILIFITFFIWEIVVVKNHCKKFSQVDGYCKNPNKINQIGLFYSSVMIFLPMLIFLWYRNIFELLPIAYYVNDALLLVGVNPLIYLILKIAFPLGK